MQKSDGGTPNASIRSNQVGQVRTLQTNQNPFLTYMYVCGVHICGRALCLPLVRISAAAYHEHNTECVYHLHIYITYVRAYVLLH